MRKFVVCFLVLIGVVSSKAQSFADKSYYLIDSLDLTQLDDFESSLVDSCIKAYHDSSHDTAKISAIVHIIEESWDYAVWPKYNAWLDQFLKERLSQKNLAPDVVWKYKEALAIVMNTKGFYYDDKGDIAKAIDYYHKGLKIREEIDDREGMALSYNNIGGIYHFMEDYSLALEYYNKSLVIEEELKDTVGMSRSYGNIGIIYNVLGDSDKGIDFMKKALTLKELVGDKEGLASGYINLGITYKQMGDLSSTIEYYEKGLKLYEEINSHRGIAMTLNNLGNLYLEKGDLEKSRACLTKSLKIAESSDLLVEVQDASEMLSGVLELGGNYKESLKMYKLFIKMRDSINNEEALKATIELQAKYEYEKKAATDSIKNAEAEKVHLANLEAEKAVSEKHKSESEARKKQNIFLFIGLGLVALFGGVMFNRFRVTKRQKNIIDAQKKVVEEKQKETELQKDKIQRQHLELEESHKEISDSIKYAERLQLATLPSHEDIEEALKDVFVLFNPKDVVSGDFYWMQKVGNKVLFAVADCTGHGVPGAMVSVVCSNALNRTVKEFGILEPSKILDKTRELVIETFARSGKDIKDGMDIALCSMEGNKLVYSGANNPLWIIRDAAHITEEQQSQRGSVISENRGLIEFKANKQPVGLYDKMDAFEQVEVELLKNDAIYLFTDGYADQFGGERNKKLMYKPFKKLLLCMNEMPVVEQRLELQRFFLNWKGENEQVDDVCVIGVLV